MTFPVMVFAAGLGTRMRPLTDTRPKALVEVAGRPLLDHALAQVAGPGPLVVNTHHFAEQIHTHLANRGLTLIHETPTLLETGGGLKNALPHLPGEAVLTTNSDSIWTGPTLRKTLLDHWDPLRMDVLMLMVPPDRALGRGGRRFALDAEGRLGLREDGLIATGAAVTKSAFVAATPRAVFSLADIWLERMSQGRLFGVVHPGRWADVGNPDAIPAAETLLERVP